MEIVNADPVIASASEVIQDDKKDWMASSLALLAMTPLRHYAKAIEGRAILLRCDLARGERRIGSAASCAQRTFASLITFSLIWRKVNKPLQHLIKIYRERVEGKGWPRGMRPRAPPVNGTQS